MTAPRPVERLPLSLLVVAAAAIAVRFSIGPFIADDAYITFRYVRNIVEGIGFVYNPGEHVLGTTTPLFTLVLAAFGRLGADVPWTAFLMGVAADVTSLVVLYRLTARLSLGWVGLIAGAFLAVTPRYLTYAVSGMETPLYIAAVLTTLFLYQTERTRTAAFASGVAALLRPDGLILAAVLAAHALVVRRRVPTRELLIFGATIVPWVAFATIYFGSPLPTSVVAKASRAATMTPAASLANLIGFFTDTLEFKLLTAFAVAGLIAGVARRVRLEAWLAWGTLYAGAFTVTSAFSHFPWYYTPLLPLYFTLAALGLGEVGQRAVEWLGRPRSRWGLLPGSLTRQGTATAAMVLVILGANLPAVARHRRTLDTWAAGRETLYRHVAEAIAREGGGNDLVAASEIGTLGYFHRGRILDLVGLISPQAIGRTDEQNVSDALPPWIVSYDSHIEGALLEAPWFIRRYKLRWTHPVSADRSLLVFQRL